ncbi:hypothetical protein GW17_00038907 [Ensete ventricosum]|nr:hypothetical protein GW17_00038907 [Ensete ventricosum]
MARPSTRVAGHLQGGGRLWPRSPAKRRPTTAKAPCKEAVGCCQDQPARATAHKRPLTGAVATHDHNHL